MMNVIAEVRTTPTRYSQIMRRCWRKILTILGTHASHFAYLLLATVLRLEPRTATFVLLSKRPEPLSLLIEAAKQDKTFQVRIVKRAPGVGHYFRSMATLASSAIIILDGHCSWLYDVKPRKGATVIQAWHAGGLFKKMGVDLCPPEKVKVRKQLLREHTAYSWIVTSAPAVNEQYAAAFGKTPAQTLPLGLISTDLLHAALRNRHLLRTEFEEKYPSLRNKKIVLYAPTFRTEETKQWHKSKQPVLQPSIDVKAFMQRFSQDYIPAFRAHYNIREAYQLDECWLNASAWPLHKALALTDVLITDYSSIFFDFLLFHKPILFFPHDLEEYMAERGFYAPYQDFVPGPICYTQQELFTKLEEITQEPTTHNNTDAMWNKYMCSCDGQVTQKILHFLKSLLQYQA